MKISHFFLLSTQTTVIIFITVEVKWFSFRIHLLFFFIFKLYFNFFPLLIGTGFLVRFNVFFDPNVGYLSSLTLPVVSLRKDLYCFQNPHFRRGKDIETISEDCYPVKQYDSISFGK